MPQKCAKLHRFLIQIVIRRSYRLIWAQKWLLISFGNVCKWTIIVEQKHWYDSLVPSPCCYFRLSTPPADLAWLGRTLSCGREQVCWDCRRQTGQDKEHTKILQLNSQTLVLSVQIWLNYCVCLWESDLSMLLVCKYLNKVLCLCEDLTKVILYVCVNLTIWIWICLL